MKSNQLSRKTTLLQKAGIFAVIVSVVITLYLRQNMEDTNLLVVSGIFFFIALVSGGSFYLVNLLIRGR